MNYCILNGARSTDIKGLLIQSLPPITKPMQRVLTETIDGKDGDKLTLLGYAAYDKTMQIALRGDYDVDGAIQYFCDNASGEVIFSNEPDKYYRYQIVKQIDFERLLRFKQAKVTFHVQPFKYSAIDRRLNFNQTAGNLDLSFFNAGNTYARPSIQLAGSGTLRITVPNMLTTYIYVDMTQTSDGWIVLDTETMNALSNRGGDTYLNRAVTGDISKLQYKPGTQHLIINGSVTHVDMIDYSRWI